MDDFTDDLENWMGKLSPMIRTIPIINLAIPGSHDSMSYGIESGAPVAPDAEPIIGSLNKVVPCIVRRWAKTQQLCPAEQLIGGIRYFDLRMSLNETDNLFYFVHGLYSEEITKPLDEIVTFLDNHPREFIIIDCQHFYNFKQKDYKILAHQLCAIFKEKLFPFTGNLLGLTLAVAAAQQKQVLIIYRTNAYMLREFWPSDCWPSPWPNKININKLEQYLNVSLNNRPTDIGYVNQCVLTPNVNYIVPRFLSSLRSTCAQKVQRNLFDWIRKQIPGRFSAGDQPTSNVFIADFIELNNFEFCKIVIGLNKKLYQDVKF